MTFVYRLIRKGEELLDNYGYHYAVMPKEERQRKLHNQYYFHCSCGACTKQPSWGVYASLNDKANLLTSVKNEQTKAVMAEYVKMQKKYKKAFDAVLQGHYEESLTVLLEYLVRSFQTFLLYLATSPSLHRIFWIDISRGL